MLLVSLNHRSQKFNFGFVAGEFVWSFEIKGEAAQDRVVDDAAERFRANLALADLCVAVFVRGKPEDAVVNVYRFQAVKPNHAVKLCQHTVEVVYNVIPGIEHVASIEAHAHEVGERYAVQNFTEFLKMRADFRALARHGLE